MPLTDTSDVAPLLDVAPQFKTVTKTLYVESPTASDELPIAFLADDATLIAVRAITNAGTVDFNIEKRNELTPGTSGANVWSADKQATSSGLEQTAFDSGAISADQWLHFSASAVSGSPAKLWVTVEYRIN